MRAQGSLALGPRRVDVFQAKILLAGVKAREQGPSPYLGLQVWMQQDVSIQINGEDVAVSP